MVLGSLLTFKWNFTSRKYNIKFHFIAFVNTKFIHTAIIIQFYSESSEKCIDSTITFLLFFLSSIRKIIQNTFKFLRKLYLKITMSTLMVIIISHLKHFVYILNKNCEILKLTLLMRKNEIYIL